MVIRKAKIEDAAAIAKYLLSAMEDIVYLFIEEEDSEKAYQFLLHFVKIEGNQYSYQHCYVVLEENNIIAAVNVYDGAKLDKLRQPIIAYIEAHYSKDFNPEMETQSGEFYIDSLGVDGSQRGRGVGSKLLQFLIDDYVVKQKHTLGLLVDEDNPQAKKLYLKLGFKCVGKKVLLGKNLEHLQYA